MMPQLVVDQSKTPETGAPTPGGRHDNDFADFHSISIYPTADEFASGKGPFYRQASEITSLDPSVRIGAHIDNQFRLLREDMLTELRDDFGVTCGWKRGQRPSRVLSHLQLVGIDTGDESRPRACAARVRIRNGLDVLRDMSPWERRRYLTENKDFMRHNSFGALCRNEVPIGFAFLVRDFNDLVLDPPVVSLRFSTSQALVEAIKAFRDLSGSGNGNTNGRAPTFQFVLVDTPVFFYEPILERLKTIDCLPFLRHLFPPWQERHNEGSEDEFTPDPLIQDFIKTYRYKDRKMTAVSIRIDKRRHKLDTAQLTAVTHALGRPVSVIQGPPGAGKSYVGTLIAKMLLQIPSTRVLVVTCTNNGLDRFLKNLLKIGVNRDVITRLGGRISPGMADLLFFSAFPTRDSQHSEELDGETDARISLLQAEITRLRCAIQGCINLKKTPQCAKVLDYVSRSGHPRDRAFLEVFQSQTNTSTKKNGSTKNTPNSKLKMWMRGQKPANTTKKTLWAWEMPLHKRKAQFKKWAAATQLAQIAKLQTFVETFNDTQAQLERAYNEPKRALIQQKRIIGCTATCAAMYRNFIDEVKPTCVIVEEAGELLESNILTALSAATQQLVLIGDYTQLSPRCQNYALSVENGAGYELNRSLFERLLIQGHKHVRLCTQNRMVPEISRFVRELTCPDLRDGPCAKSGQRIKGLVDRVVFIDHRHLEEIDTEVLDRRDAGQSASKSNRFEAEMVSGILKHLLYQGYARKDIIILTPYLGQLRLLQDILIGEYRLFLNDADSHELIRAGQSTPASQTGRKKKRDNKEIYISTIDNYTFQNEEVKVVIASLTRSNLDADIGFMRYPQRLNVLVSSAWRSLIMLGNIDTFTSSPYAGDIWLPFVRLLRENDQIKTGFELKCMQHDRTAIISNPVDFDALYLGSYCTEKCGMLLSCGVHTCCKPCHAHDKTTCVEMVEVTCENQHTFQVQCGMAVRCPQCEVEEQKIRQRGERDTALQIACFDKMKRYRAELREIQDEILHIRRLIKSGKLETSQDQRGYVINWDDCTPENARDEWEFVKDSELACSAVLDELMDMIGLDQVKREFLNMKYAIDTAVLGDDNRYMAASEMFAKFGRPFLLLGNPGTGKTTVARLYTRFLAYTGVLAGDFFQATTGDALSEMDVPGCQELLETMLNQGGGCLFVDKAQSLSSSVLEFLLDEADSLSTKICLILAGHALDLTEMRSFVFPDLDRSALSRILDTKLESQGLSVTEQAKTIILDMLDQLCCLPEFTNAHAVEAIIQDTATRHQARLLDG